LHASTPQAVPHALSPPPGPPESAASTLPADTLWTTVCDELRDSLSEGNFSAWFGRAKPLALQPDTLVLGVPNAFTKEWIEGRYLTQLRAAVSHAAHRSMQINLRPGHGLDPEPQESPSPPSGPSPAAPPSTDSPPTEFHPKYSFESFVIGSSNRFAHAAALAIAEAPAQTYNPLFIYAGAGLGKTHLLHAIGRSAHERHPELVTRYISSEQFMNEFILALQRRTIPDFHRRYRAADLLLVDDIQFLEGKERTQEEFFHTFNALHPRSQIVITSDRPPKRIPTLEERLRTRFEWGLITDIQPPDLETRLAILQRKAETEGLAIPLEVMSFIATRIQTNIRELEGALIRVAAYASFTNSLTDVAAAQTALRSLLPDAAETRVTPELVIAAAAEYFDITPEAIRSPSRSRPLVNARQVSMYLCRELTDLSLPKIGKHFGGRDHTTVLHATTKVRRQLQEEDTWYEQVNELTARIRQHAARGWPGNKSGKV
jgi:chromosomal replication initiator protein